MTYVTQGSQSFDVASAVVDPAGHTWPLSVDGAGNLDSDTDPLNHSWNFSYDQAAGAPDYHDLTGITDPEEVPAKLQSYIEFLERELEVPIKYLSVGPDRVQTLVLH